MSTPVNPHPVAWAARPALIGPRDLPAEQLRGIQRGLGVGLVVGGLLVIATQPAARRLAGQALRLALTTWVPALIVREVRGAWQRSAAVPPAHEGV